MLLSLCSRLMVSSASASLAVPLLLLLLLLSSPLPAAVATSLEPSCLMRRWW
jgi:hypothetical protein